MDNVHETLDLASAARVLGLSREALRKRLQRGRLKGYKDEAGAWQVVLPSGGPPMDMVSKPVQDKAGQEPNGQSPLVEALRSEVAFLRGELQARTEEVRRSHILLQQIQELALPAPQPDPERVSREARRKARAELEGAMRPVLLGLLDVLRRRIT